MSNRFHPMALRRAGIVVAAALVIGIIPAGAQAAPAINLATASPFVVLGGSEVTNTGPSVLKGELGVWSGTSLTGFEPPGVVNGAIHNSDPVAAQAQSDLTNAFNVAGEQPVVGELTGLNLGGLELTTGAYRYTSSAQLTGQLTLNAQGNPKARFVFIIGSTLTTASVSSVNLVNGASPCNVFWRIGSSATLGEGTQFQGNLMALTSITLNDAVHVDGRVLARNAKIELHNDVLDNSKCTAESETEAETETTGGDTSTPVSTPTPTTTATGGTTGTPVSSTGGGKKAHRPSATTNGTSTVTHGPQGPNGTAVRVKGKRIAKIEVRVGNKTVETSTAPGLRTTVNGAPGTHTVTVRVHYKDNTPGKTTKFRIHVPQPAPLQPQQGPSQFTG